MPNYNYPAGRPPARIPQRRSRWSFWLLLLGAATGTVMLLASRAEAQIQTIEDRIIQAEMTKPNRSASRLQLKQLEDDINQLIAAEPGARISVSLHDFVTGKTLHYGADDSFVAASVPKLLTASLWLHEVDQGKRTLDESVGGRTAREQLKLLIEVSDNAAWELLDAELGKKALEDYARSIGMKQYDFDNNALSTADTLKLLQRLQSGTLISDSSRKLLLQFMENANYRQYIVAALPDETKSYHKVGFLGDRVLDAAIVEAGRLSYGVVIFAEAKSAGFDLASAGQTIRAITETIHARYLMPTN